jgi:hypothetical protein
MRDNQENKLLAKEMMKVNQDIKDHASENR